MSLKIHLSSQILTFQYGGFSFMQSFFAGIAASGALTSGMRLITKAAFDKAHDGLRKGASM